jgi:hypothetical protein
MDALRNSLLIPAVPCLTFNKRSVEIEKAGYLGPEKVKTMPALLHELPSMKTTKLTLLVPVLVLAAAIQARAGDGTAFYHRESVKVCVKERRHCPFGIVARATETILHWPRILAEGIEGDRVCVSPRGILAPREMPVEDRILSPAD